MLYGSRDRPLKLMIGLNRNMPYITYTSSLTDLTSNTTDEGEKKETLYYTFYSIYSYKSTKPHSESIIPAKYLFTLPARFCTCMYNRVD